MPLRPGAVPFLWHGGRSMDPDSHGMKGLGPSGFMIDYGSRRVLIGTPEFAGGRWIPRGSASVARARADFDDRRVGQAPQRDGGGVRAPHQWRSLVAMLDDFKGKLGGARPEYIIVFLLIAILGLLNALEFEQRFFLNFYFLPVVLAGYLLGRAGGVMSAVASISVVVLYALVNPGVISSFGVTPREFWADITLWGGFLVLTGGALGHLYEARNRAYADLTKAYDGVLEILVKFIDTADRYTEAHSVRVSILSTEIARQMQLPEQEIEDIRVAALLHDVGKLDVSIDVIRKAGKLDDDEWEQLKKHPEHGANIVRSVGGLLSNAVPLILFHHEQYGGNGYYKRKGEQIPLGSRIIAVADAFDAMTTDRPYQKARQSWEALEIIQDGAGDHFDPDVVDAFSEVIRRRPAGLERVEATAPKLH